MKKELKKQWTMSMDYGNEHIDILSLEQREHWCSKLGCSSSDLIIAEHKVGPKINEIQKYLSQ